MTRLGGRGWAVLFALVVVLALGASNASAWTPIDGSRPRWRPPVPYSMHSAGSADLGPDTTEMIVQQAMGDWTRVSCTNLTSTYRGRVSNVPGTYEGVSVIGWLESGWPHDTGAIGVTAPAWASSIVEADMQLNGANYRWVTGPGSGGTVNTYSIVLHEGGHYYGLGHSSDPSATMYFAYTGGIDSLTADDQAGICALYPGDGTVTDCRTTGCPAGQECVGGTCQPIVGDGDVCSPCSSGGDCTRGYCIMYPDGAGYCGRDCTSSADCGSDVCADLGGIGQCVRLDGDMPSCATTTTGCRNDSDCDATDRCDVAMGRCVARPTGGRNIGEPCADPSECNSGTCLHDVCSETCDWLDVASCPGGFYCDGNVTGTCGEGYCVAGAAGAAELGAACTVDADCATLQCSGGICASPCIPGGTTGCPAGYACQEEELAGCGACKVSGSLGDICMMNDDCASGICAVDSSGGRTFCTRVCDDATACPTDFACTPIGDSSVCVPQKGGLGETCTADTDCLSGICAAEGSRRYCTRFCGTSTPCPPMTFSCEEVAGGGSSVCRPTATTTGGGRDRGGCGCVVPGGHATGGASAGAWIAALTVTLLAGRARRRRSKRAVPSPK